MRRFLMATGAAAMSIALLVVACLVGVLSTRGLVVAAILSLLLVLALYATFRSGLNRRFEDPSLTSLQIFASTLVILYALYEAKDAHGAIGMIFMVSFMFGVFRLGTRRFLELTAFVSVSYAAIIALQWQAGMDLLALRQKVLTWIMLTSVLAFFSLMGGYVSRMRKDLANSKVSLESAVKRIEQMASRDELTDVRNRRSLVEALREQKHRADRYGGTFGILMMDIDHFKRVNDTYGHHAGDMVLKKFARATAGCLRDSDIFGRYGGEEFLAILEQTPSSRLHFAAERICEVIRRLEFDELAPGLRISVSLGGAEYRKQEDTKATIARADQALYTAKKNGRDRFECDTGETA